jgi:hypothetical protein
MNLGTQTASLVNHLQSRATLGQPKPVVGMGVTFLSWTDRNPGTITEVIEIGGSKRYLYEIKVVGDTVTWDEEKNPVFGPGLQGFGQACIYKSKKASGEWVEMQRSEKGNLVESKGRGLRIGKRDYYRDPSF